MGHYVCAKSASLPEAGAMLVQAVKLLAFCFSAKIPAVRMASGKQHHYEAISIPWREKKA